MWMNINTKSFLFVLYSVIFVGCVASHANNNVKSIGKDGPDNTKGTVYINGYPARSDVVLVKRKRINFKNNAQNISWDMRLQKLGIQKVCSAFPMIKDKQSSAGMALSQIIEVHIPRDRSVIETIHELSRDPDVEYAEPWYIRNLYYDPNDPDIFQQWYISKIMAREAWDITQGDTSVVIGIVDTGVNWEHPDLMDNVWNNPGEIPDNELDDDFNGFVDDVYGWDFGGVARGEPDNDPRDFDYHYHGTSVAGVASAVTDNGLGIASPAFKAKIMAVKTSVDEDDEPVIVYGYSGILYAVDNGADIINCSWGSGGTSETERYAIEYARTHDVLVVAAAGNTRDESFHYPAALDGVLSVLNVYDTDYKSYQSTYGYWVDVAAPGNLIYTTSGFGSYIYVGGTSFSSPLAASVAALVKGQHPDWIGEQLGEQVRITADAIPDPLYTAQKLGSGRINAYRAVTETGESIRLMSYTLEEGDASNHDDIFDPGDEILLTFSVKNFLEPADNVTLQFQTNHAHLNIPNNIYTPGSMNPLSTFNNEQDPLRMTISTNAARGEKIDIFLMIATNNGQLHPEYLQLVVSQSYSSITGGHVELTLSSSGRLGFVDYPENTAGVGFQFGENENLLFEGAFMAASSGNVVSDVARGADESGQNNDFYEAFGGELVVDKNISFADEYAETIFTDEGIANALNLLVKMEAHSFYETPDDDFILLTYKIAHQNQVPLNNLHIGLFADWDVGDNGNNAATNKPGYDPSCSMGYIYDEATQLHAGIRILNNFAEMNYYSINNDEIYDGYNDQEKWNHLSGGIQPILDTDAYDYSHVLGIGPFTLSPTDTVVIGFALLGGENLNDLVANAQAAQTKWDGLYPEYTLVQNPKNGPLTFQLHPNWPNPFNAVTTIAYDIPVHEHIKLAIFDLMGREVTELVNEKQEPGHYEIRWDVEQASHAAASGVYFIRLTAESFQNIQKMILIK